MTNPTPPQSPPRGQNWAIYLWGYEESHDYGLFEEGFASEAEAEARAAEIRRAYELSDDPLADDDIRIVELVDEPGRDSEED